jgi:hypothetical protein
MNTEEYKKLVRARACETGADPDTALQEFVAAVRQMGLARAESDRVYGQLEELGRQYAWYRNGEPYGGSHLLDEAELGRRYAETKGRQRAANKLLSIRCNQVTGLLGSGNYFRHGRPVPAPTCAASQPTGSPSTHQKSELIILTDPDDGEPIILEMFS